jgi:hypothetical protein
MSLRLSVPIALAANGETGMSVALAWSARPPRLDRVESR